MQNEQQLSRPYSPGKPSTCRTAIRRLVFVVASFSLLSMSYADRWPIRRSLELYEMRLLRGLMEHHQIVSEMASLAQDRAVHPELAELTQYKTWAMRSRIDDFQELLADWYDTGHEPEVSRRDERVIERLTALEGDNYEFAFLTELVRQNSIVLRMGRRAERRTGHPELQMMWANLKAELEGENAQANLWLCQWHGRCRGTDFDTEEPAATRRRR